MLIAVSQLPAMAEDKPEVFPKRGGFERLSLAYATVEIGLEKPFSVLHISDTHFTAAYPHESEQKQKLREVRTQCFGGRQEEAMRDSLAWARDHVDYVLHTGDLIDWQSEANLDLVRKYLGDGITGCMGNHEFSPDMWLSEPKQENTEAYKDRSRAMLQKTFPFDISFNAQQINGVNFICLDNVYGTVTPQQVTRSEARAPHRALHARAIPHRPDMEGLQALLEQDSGIEHRRQGVQAHGRLSGAEGGQDHTRIHLLPQAGAAAQGHPGGSPAHHGRGAVLTHGTTVCGGRQLPAARQRSAVCVIALYIIYYKGSMPGFTQLCTPLEARLPLMLPPACPALQVT